MNTFCEKNKSWTPKSECALLGWPMSESGHPLFFIPGFHSVFIYLWKQHSENHKMFLDLTTMFWILKNYLHTQKMFVNLNQMFMNQKMFMIFLKCPKTQKMVANYKRSSFIQNLFHEFRKCSCSSKILSNNKLETPWVHLKIHPIFI